MFTGLADKVVLVTGGASGIGASFAVESARAGAKVAILDRDEAGLARVAHQLDGLPIITLPVDISDSQSVAEAIATTTQQFGRLDGCFSNAGVTAPFIEFADTPDDLYERIVRINQFGSFYVIKHAMAVMREQRSGSIVCTSSTSGIRGVPAFATYCASKHAVIGMMRVAAMDGAKYGIRVNAICPGMTDTPINHATHEGWSPGDPAAAMKAVAAKIPMGRYGEPEELAASAAFLLSDAASYITGQVLNVDGGVTTGPGF